MPVANTLKLITARAKSLYKTGKYPKWTDAIKAASKLVVPFSRKQRKPASRNNRQISALGSVKKVAIKKARKAVKKVKKLAKVINKKGGYGKGLILPRAVPKKKISGYKGTKREGRKTTVLYSNFSRKISGLFDTSIISDIDKLKKEYHKLAKKYHPDAGGSKEQFQQLEAEYKKHFAALLKGSKLSQDQQDNEIVLDEALRKAANAIVSLPGITIELNGKWLWVSGNTYPIRNELKSAGFLFASAKKQWFYKGVESSGRGDFTMDDIRNKYGSTKIMEQPKGNLLNGYGKITRVQRKQLKAALGRAGKALNKRPI